ncbi:RpnC/YadD family protein [Thiocapsa bogorovii]|uniref:hypothetical protein n=1 Tax=Thiocapsa bogorovii TaxID=521689 RepID=UPI001E6167B8|nr:hypothetical protein [Thiocapsa bogorovii]UHD16906.1 hypothetical protein LT988_02245 [Thiocapsa bogorovii]
MSLCKVWMVDIMRETADRLARLRGRTQKEIDDPLPSPLEDDCHRAIQAIEEAEQVRYVTTAERIGIRKGMERGMERGIKRGMEKGLESERALLQRQARRRFGDAVTERAAVLLALIRAPETLEQLGEALLDDKDGELWLTAVQAQVERAGDRMDAAGDASPAG